MFDERQVYGRTAKGDEQFDARSAQLLTGARRILRLIDGQRSLADLTPLARPGDLERIVDELQSNGLIRLIGIAETPSTEEARAMDREQREELSRLQGALAGRFEQVLGIDGMVLDARLQDCVSLDVLRRVMREAVDTLSRRASPQAAEQMLNQIRPLYEDFALTVAAKRTRRITRL